MSAAKFTVNMAPKYQGATYAANRVMIAELPGAGFTVGAVRRGFLARQVSKGPLVPGPWAYAFANASVIDCNGGTARAIEADRASGTLIECRLGDTLVVFGDEYAIVAAANRNIELVRTLPVIPFGDLGAE